MCGVALAAAVLGVGVGVYRRSQARPREAASESATRLAAVSPADKVDSEKPPPLPARQAPAPNPARTRRELIPASSCGGSEAPPAHDRAPAEQITALSNAKPQDAAPALEAIASGARDRAALEIASGLAEKLPPAEAAERLAEIVSKEGAPPSAYRALAQIQINRGQSREACEGFRRGLEKHPVDFALREAYARYLARLGRRDEAVAVCLDALDARGADRSAALRRLILAGEIEWEGLKKDEAKATWRRLVDAAPSRAEGTRYYEQVLARHGGRP